MIIKPLNNLILILILIFYRSFILLNYGHALSGRNKVPLNFYDIKQKKPGKCLTSTVTFDRVEGVSFTLFAGLW